MSSKKSIQLKAAFLMIVFGLNTVVGFACAVGMNFKSGSHHAEEKKSQAHIHSDGSKHVHETGINKSETKGPSVKEYNKKSEEECCTEKISKFDQLDKVPSSKITFAETVLFLSATSQNSNINLFYTSYINTGIKYFVRSYHPPIPNIRIAIQSFQI